MSASPNHTQRGYILSSVVVLSIVIFATSLIVLQYVSAVYSSVGSTIRTDTARQIANEQMRSALACAEEADSYDSCVKTNTPTGSLNGYPSSVSIGFTPSTRAVDITSTATVGLPPGLHDAFTVRAQAPIKSSPIQTLEFPAPPADDSEWITKLTAGSNHTCALTNEKRLYCWGDNAQGQIGTGNTTAQTSPYLVGLTGVDDVDAGMFYTCAIADPNRTVYCWGWNGHGQLGRGHINTTDAATRTPQAIPGTTNATSVSAANSHTCTINTTNQLRCWGRNDSYQIGTGTKSTQISSPHLVTNSNINNSTAKPAKVSAGHAHTCVIRTDSKLYCWGLSEQGAVTGFYAGSAINPSLQDGGRSYREVKAGHWHTCGIDTTSRVRCWGYNHNGQTGKSRPWTNVWGPDFINSPPNTATVIDSFAHNCAAAEGSVYCWGNPGQYRIGNGGSNVWTPYKVSGLTQATAVTTGDRHSCAAVNSGRQVRCWGDNTQGQFGSPDATKSPTSVRVTTALTLNPGTGSGSFQSDSISAGRTQTQHVCATQNGDVYCWGDNTQGQLGDGSTINSFAPVKVLLGDGKATQISIGLNYSCALLVDETVKCWGDNASGQLGDGTTTMRPAPTTVSMGGNKVKQISSGTRNACALLTNGSVRCWGNNEYGGNGNGLTTGNQPVPAAVNLGGLKAKSISVGTFTGCAILEDDTLRCWGWNGTGQMGNGTTSDYQLTPTSPNLDNLKVRSVSIGYATICAILEDDTLRCWGWNEMGQVGNGTKNNPILTPTAVSLGGQKPRQVSVGFYHACAVLENDEVRCWGNNAYKALGNGTISEALTPTPTSLGSQPVKEIDVSLYVSCVSTLNNATRCWGLGALGNPAITSSDNPVSVINPPKPVPSIVSAGNQHTCAIDNKENILCWGGNAAAELGDGTRVSPRTKPITVNTGGRKALEVSAGDQHTCAVLKDGTVLCWGYNSNGQIGQGSTTTTHYTSPATVNLGGKKATQVSANGATTCAVLEDGELKCWGWNSNGQIGDGSTVGTTQNRPTPVTINLGGARAVQVSVGSWHTCAVLQSSTSNGNVKCWGHNGNGKLGINSTTDQRSPVDVRLGGQRAKQISASQYHTCAVLESEDAMCWGFGGDGRLGTGSTTQRLTPFAVSLSGRKVDNISTGAEHTCAALKDKSTFCWGKNANNQLGNGNTTSYQIPQPVGHPGSSNTTYVSAGWTHTCAVISIQIRCWGGNATYQLGDTTNTTRVFPTAAIIERTRYEEAVVY